MHSYNLANCGINILNIPFKYLKQRCHDILATVPNYRKLLIFKASIDFLQRIITQLLKLKHLAHMIFLLLHKFVILYFGYFMFYS